MIIKRQKNSPSGSPQKGGHFGLEPNALSDMSLSPEDEWNEQSIKDGLVSERRSAERSSDRRRGYRRIEDQHLISKAHEEANAIREQAQERGLEEGLQQAQGVIDELQDAIARLLNAREEALLSVTSEIAAIAVEVAGRIIKTEVSCDETLVMGLVRDTIQKAGRNSKSILIKVNTDDMATVKKVLKDDPIPNLNAELIVMDDPTVDSGSCIIETNSGLIDASFSTQLGTLKQLFGGTG